MDPRVSPITPAEVPALLELIRELARFEHLEHEMEATVESLTQSLFASSPVAGAFLAHDHGRPAGYAIYFFTFSSFLGRPGIWLEDVYVRPELRRRGLGRALIHAVAQIGAERHCGRFEWTALHWNTPALEIYRKMGAREMREWLLLRMNSPELRRLASTPLPSPPPPTPTPTPTPNPNPNPNPTLHPKGQ